MKTATAQFKAEGIELGEQLDKLNKTKATLTVDLTKAQAELRSARKGLDDTKESMDRLEQAQYNYNNIKQNLGLVAKQAKETEKAFNSMSEAITTNKELMGKESGASAEHFPVTLRPAIFHGRLSPIQNWLAISPTLCKKD